ncbi:MAG: hypothetical protein U1D31_02720 [Patescibacteria group bacterium]|nr:hypothetical protein [bacterium]MDZ4241005.1 hypothetical protein [Patescibacteria group bacterium]
MENSIEKTNRHVVFWVITVAIVIAILALWAFASSFSRTLNAEPPKDDISLEVELL